MSIIVTYFVSDDKRPVVLEGFLYSRLKNLVYCGAIGDPQSAVILPTTHEGRAEYHQPLSALAFVHDLTRPVVRGP